MDDTTGSLIAAARRARGWNQRELAEAIYTTQTCISYWETSRRDITVHDLLAVASALNVTPATLIPGENPTPHQTPPPNLVTITADLRDILHRLETNTTGPDNVLGWATMPTHKCTTRSGKHWHLFLHTADGADLSISGLHFNTEPDATAWARANLPMRHVTHRPHTHPPSM